MGEFMKKNKAIAIFFLLFIIFIILITCTSLYTNKQNNAKVLAAVVKPDVEGGSSIKYIVPLENLSSIINVTSCVNSTRTLIRLSNSTGSTKNVYACVYKDKNINSEVNCPENYVPTVGQIIYGTDNNGTALARFCQNVDANKDIQNNNQSGGSSGSTGNSGASSNTSSSTPSNSNEKEEDNTIYGGGKDTGNVSSEEANPRLEYDNICASEGFMVASKLAGTIILIAKWLAPLILMIMGMIDFFKAIISSNDKAISDATTTFIKRMVIAIIIPILPGLLYSLINFLIGEEVNGIKIEYGECTKCLNYPLDKEECNIKLYDYDNK